MISYCMSIVHVILMHTTSNDTHCISLLTVALWLSVCSWCDESSDQSLMVDPLSYCISIVHVILMHTTSNATHCISLLTVALWLSICSWCDGSHGGPIKLFLIPASVLHIWYNKGCGICYPVCGMVHTKEPLLLIEKSSP